MNPQVLDITNEEHHAMPGLSASGMKDLAVSPLRYWYLHVNPEAPVVEPSPEMIFGSALHCAVLELDQFDRRYAKQVTEADYPGCLVTIEDLRNFLREAGLQPKGTRKADVVAQVQSAYPEAPIWDVIEQNHFRANAGKTILSAEDWERVTNAAKALLEEPRLVEILQDGRPEVSMVTKDEETGITIKARMDWLAPHCIMDLKTFSQKRTRSIDETVADAIYYERYHRQAFVYSMVRGWPKDWQGDFVLSFVESQPPHETRIKALRPKTGGNANVYWEHARIETLRLIRLYAECMAHFGVNKPWRYAQDITPLADEEMKALAYA
jgi:hypothetical protein